MASTFTTNKNLNKQGSGDNSGTWDVALNGNFDVIDKGLAGTQSYTLGSSTVNMTQTELQNVRLKFTGTLTANVAVTVPLSIAGMFWCDNQTTGAFSVTIKQISGDTGIVLQQSKRTLIFSDGTNCRDANDRDVAFATASTTATSATNATNATNLINGSSQTITPTSTNTWVVTSASGQTTVALKLVYGSTTGGYVQSDSGGVKVMNSSNTLSATFDNSGNFTAVANVTAYSDERVKEDWQGISSAIIREMATLRSGTYKRTDLPADAPRQVGVGAQSLEELLPEAVITDENGVKSVNYGGAALALIPVLCRELQIMRVNYAVMANRLDQMEKQ